MTLNLKRALPVFLLSILILTLTACKSDPAKPEIDDPEPDVNQARFEPPDGQCLFILGQSDEEQMMDYLFQVRSTPVPAGFAFYTSLSNGAVQMDMPRYKSFSDNYPNTTLQLAIWTGERQWGTPGNYLDEISNGQYDQNIMALAEACKGFDKPIFIRFGYEFDGWHNAYPPDKYIDAYQYFVDKMRAAGVTNVAYVWHSWGVGAYYGTADYPDYYPPLPAGQEITQELWYPGDEYVDWVAMSVFGIGWGNLETNTVVQWLIAFAENHDKPVMLAETAAIKTSGQSDPAWVIPNTNWFEHVFNLCDNHDAVKAFTYINVDWEQDNPASTWGDTRIQAAAQGVGRYWLQELGPLLHADSSLYTIINYAK